MNRHTFQDVLSTKRKSIINEMVEDQEDDSDDELQELVEKVDGEVEGDIDKFNDAGEVLEAFNLKDERERGKFDSNMNFVFEKNNTEIDSWVADLDETTMEKGIGEAVIARKRMRELELIAQAKSEAKRVKGSFVELCLHLLKLLLPGETLGRAMRRSKGVNTSKHGVKSIVQDSSPIEQITDIADQLISYGITGIYEMAYESIESMISLWEYQATDGTMHGPFPFSSIADWKRQGYFIEAGAVPMRRVLNPNEKSMNIREKSGVADEEPSNNDDDDDDDEDEGHGGRIDDVILTNMKKRSHDATERKKDKHTSKCNNEGVSNHPKKRVKFEEPTKSKNEVNEDLLDDLDDDEEEEDEENLNEVSTSSTMSSLLTLAASTSSFDSQGRGPWIMSDEIIDYESIINVNKNTF